MARLFLKTHDHLFASRPLTTAGKYTSYNYQDILFSPSTDHWKQGRKIYLNEVFSTKRLDSSEYIRVQETHDFVLCKRFDRFYEHVFDEHRDMMKYETEGFVARDVVDVLLKLVKDPNLEVKLNSDAVKGLTQDLIVGAADSTITTIEWAMSELIKQPHLIKKATEELDRVIGKERWGE
ncbi:hypothetical protein L2E82_37618 [Cichorium intybus]|uniref:Uncharacterized protein n=1 Tax=Cichorium intybus TaxID=13427 RepID=A0ACB9AF36_CICIN|nr:hypothetical protein L2E82_37618 [Cichorium intybus]